MHLVVAIVQGSADGALGRPSHFPRCFSRGQLRSGGRSPRCQPEHDQPTDFSSGERARSSPLRPDPEGLVPTAAAEEIVPRAELFEVTAAELIGAIEGLDTRPGGVVRVASPVLIASELLAPALPAFLDEQPGLRLELIVGDAIVDLSRREADLALRFVRPDRGDLLVRRVGTLRFAVFGSKAYLDVHRGQRAEELAWLDWDTTQAQLPDAAWLRAEFPGIEPVLRTNNLGVRLRATRAGLGVSVLADRSRRATPSSRRSKICPRFQTSRSGWLGIVHCATYLASRPPGHSSKSSAPN